MAEAVNPTIHPAATQHLPSFITAPGETDVLMIVTALILIGAVVGIGVLFLRLHSLPEHIAHKSNKIQLEIVCVLALISMFTNMHIFWIIGLLLAVIDLPDFGTPLNRIAGSTERLAGLRPGEGAADAPAADAEHAAEPHATSGDSRAPAAEIIPVQPKGRIHA